MAQYGRRPEARSRACQAPPAGSTACASAVPGAAAAPPTAGAAGGHGEAGVQRQVRHAHPPAGDQDLGAGRLVVLAERGGQVPGVQVPLGTGGTHHAANGHHGVAEAVVRKVPDRAAPGWRRPARRPRTRRCARARSRRPAPQARRVLPGQLAGQALRAGAARHQPGQPADRRVVEVLVVVVGHAAKVARPGRRRATPGTASERSHASSVNWAASSPMTITPA